MLFFMVLQVFTDLIPNIKIDSPPDVELALLEALKIKEDIFKFLWDQNSFVGQLAEYIYYLTF